MVIFFGMGVRKGLDLRTTISLKGGARIYQEGANRERPFPAPLNETLQYVLYWEVPLRY